MTSRVIPTRHGITEPHRIGEGSYLEAYSGAPPLNVLEGHERKERRETRMHSSSSNDDDEPYGGGGGGGPAAQPPLGSAPPRWPSANTGGIPFDAFPVPPPVPFFMHGGDTREDRHLESRPRYGASVGARDAFVHSGGNSLPQSTIQPIPDLSWSRFGAPLESEGRSHQFPFLPPPPPGFHPSEWHTTAAAAPAERHGPRLRAAGDDGSHGDGRSSSDTQPWPTPRDVVLPELFPFPPPFLPPPPTFDELRAGAVRHGVGDEDFPWLPPAGRSHPLESWSAAPGARGPGGPAEAAAATRLAHSGHVDPAASSAAPMRSGSTSADEHERLKSLAEFARRRFLAAGGGSRSASNTTERSSSSAAGGGARGVAPAEVPQRHGAAATVRTASASRPTTTTYRVHNDYRAGISALMSREEQLRLKQQREERINARRRSCMNTSSTATSVAAPTPRNTRRKPTSHDDEPRSVQNEPPAAAPAAAPPASRRAEADARAATPRTSTPSSRRGPGGASGGATATASHRGAVRETSSTDRPRGITLTALKGETPKLERVMRDGLPSERRRMDEFAASRSAQLPDAHRTSFIGFGATQYTPFVDLAKRDPRAAEYMRGIEHLYHQLRSSYEQFQKDPAQFLKGPSLSAVRHAAQSPRREADDRAAAAVPSPAGKAAASSPNAALLGGPGGQSPGSSVAPPLPLSGTTPPRVPQLHVPDMQLSVEPSAETRKLREELDRLEHQWTRLNDVRSAIHETSLTAATPGGGHSTAASPMLQSSATLAPGRSAGFELAAPASASAAAPTPDSVSLRVRSQLQGQPEHREGDVFSYENVLGLVRERRQQQPNS